MTNHCTDWPQASEREAGNDQDVTVTGDHYTAYVPFEPPLTLNPVEVQLVLPFIPDSAEWHALFRPNERFVVFYTETAGSDALTDLDPTAVPNNHDQGGDTVPDYAERIYQCAVTAQERYANHFALTPDQEQLFFEWMLLDYRDPTTGTLETGQFYPIVIRDDGNRAFNWSIANELREGMLVALDVPLGATYISIDSTGDIRRGTSPWLYAWTENVLYHEMFHAYQAIFKSRTDAFGFTDWWLYEGTAMYGTDQALLPPCSADYPDAGGNSLNPPRVDGLTFSSDCRIPTRHERLSEQVIGNDADHMFLQPWRGMTRDNGQSGAGSIAYSSVLFWYYAQNVLQAQANDIDVVKRFWQDGGTQGVLERWSRERLETGGLAEVYHRFMVDNYLQEIPSPYTGFDNPYFETSQHWVGWSGGWNANPSATATYQDYVSIFPIDQITNLTLNIPDTLTGDDGTSDIEYLGTRYYTIDPDPSAPLTSTLELNVFFDEPFAYRGYQITVLDMQVDPTTKEPQAVRDSIHLTEQRSGLARIPNFGGADRRLVVVVSKVADRD